MSRWAHEPGSIMTTVGRAILDAPDGHAVLVTAAGKPEALVPFNEALKAEYEERCRRWAATHGAPWPRRSLEDTHIPAGAQDIDGPLQDPELG